MTRSIEFAPKEFYHLYNRGTEKRRIFMARSDYDRFLALLYLCNQSVPAILKIQGRTLEELVEPRVGDQLVDIAAYCLMPNHVHVIAHERQENGISKFMQKVMTGYTMYVNKKYERSGALFQGKFKATHINNDRYFAYLISYVHLNPIKLIEPKWKEIGIVDRKRAEQYLKNYRYSSYLDYLGQERVEEIILNKNVLPKYFSSGLDFKRFVTEWLNYNSE